MGQIPGPGCSCAVQVCPPGTGGRSTTSAAVPSRCVGARSSGYVGSASKFYNLDCTAAGRFPGRSAFSTAFRAVHHLTEEQRVVRVVLKSCCERDRLLRDLDLLRRVDHPNLARVIEVLEDRRVICVVMELAMGDDLLTTLGSSGRPMLQGTAAHLLRQLLLALKHLHSVGLVHEDVHPRNIAVAAAAGGPSCAILRLKLIDFGLAARHTKSSLARRLLFCHCWAPEQACSPASPRMLLMDPCCDVWAVGAVAFVLLSGNWPFQARSPELLRQKVQKGCWSFSPSEAWAPVDESARDFVSSLLVASTTQRPSADSALAHAFVQPSISKGQPQVVPRSRELTRSLRKLAANRILTLATVDALVAAGIGASRASAGLEDAELAAEEAPLSLLELRRGLHRSGVSLPGNFLGPLLDVEGDDEFALSAEELLEAATIRARNLEETVAWLSWSAMVPEGSLRLRREAVAQVLEHGGDALRRTFGHAALQSAAASMSFREKEAFPDHVTFEDFLKWLRCTGSRRSARSFQRCFQADGHQVSAIELELPGRSQLSK
mmetsp:Transcript_61725/g.133738  ORF Transcript_61725/g.133738 Transcript_61725/m.133738 type:complete len:549 (-) Transcript_61725:90-1736(-)